MIQNTNSRSIDGFLPLNNIYTSKIKRNSSFESSHYYCFNGDFPLSIGAVKIYNNKNNSTLDCQKEWISDNKDIFLLKHYIQNSPYGQKSCPSLLSSLESSLQEKIDADANIQISYVNELCDDSLPSPTSDSKSECTADLHAALDCIAELDSTGIVRHADVNAFSIRSNYAQGAQIAESTISGVKYHNVIILMADQRINADELDAILCEHSITNALSHKQHEIRSPLSVYVVASGPDSPGANENHMLIKQNILSIIEALVA